MKLFPFFINISSTSYSLKKFLTIVCKLTTVGIPITIISLPRLFFDSSFLTFPTPLPGSIDESVICITLFIFSMLVLDNASIIIKNSGLVLSTIPFIISYVSIPLV